MFSESSYTRLLVLPLGLAILLSAFVVALDPSISALADTTLSRPMQAVAVNPGVSGTPTTTTTGSTTSTATSTATRTSTGSTTPTTSTIASPTPSYTPTPTATPTVARLDLDIFKLDGTELKDDEGGQPDDEIHIGSMNCVNNDNDDKDSQFDIDDTGVASENDLVKMIARKPVGITTGKVVLSQLSGADKAKVWKSSTKAILVNLPVEIDISDLPRTFWVEGTKGSTAQRDVKFKLSLKGSDAVAPDVVALTVIQITKVKWVGKNNSIDDDNNLDADPHDPHWPNAERVFPDARKAGDPARDKVKVRVRLSVAPIGDLDIYLRSFDVDDPAPLDTEVDPNDDGSSGTYPNTSITYTANEDNRGKVGGKKYGMLDGADADGIAKLTFPAGAALKTTEFQVTKQPGDNFRVVAVCDQNFAKELRNLDQEDQQKIVDQNNKKEIPDADKQASVVLTVWRRLHLERDSMAAPAAADNRVDGMTTNVVNGAAAGTSDITTDQNLPDTDQYQCPAADFPAICFLSIGAGPTRRKFKTLSNTTGANSEVTVQNDATGKPPQDKAFRMHDDDRDDILPKKTGNGWMKDSDDVADNRFAAAYVRPIYDGGGTAANNEDNFNFDLNTEDAEAENAAYYTPGTGGKRQSTNADDFWDDYLLGVFQGPLLADHDPNTQGADLGFNPGIAGDHNVVVVYQEAFADACIRSGLVASEQATTAHEVGHSFGGEHADGGLMKQGCKKANNFKQVTLNRIRSTRRPGAGSIAAPPKPEAGRFDLRALAGAELRSRPVTNDLALSIAAEKNDLIVGEPVRLRLTLTNTSSQSISGNFDLPFAFGRTQIYIARDQGGFEPYLSKAGLIALTKDLALEPTTIAPHQSITVVAVVSFDVNRNELALPQAGNYLLQATHAYDIDDLRRQVDSNIIPVRVREPVGVDRVVINLLRQRGLLPYLTDEGTLFPNAEENLIQLRLLLSTYPANTYRPYLDEAIKAVCVTTANDSVCGAP